MIFDNSQNQKGGCRKSYPAYTVKEYYINTAFLKEGYNTIKAVALFDSNYYKGEGLFNGSYSKINYVDTNVLAYYEPDEGKQNPVEVLKEPWHFDKIQVANMYEKDKIIAESDEEAVHKFVELSGRKIARNKLNRTRPARTEKTKIKSAQTTENYKVPETICFSNNEPTEAEKKLFKYCHLYRIISKEKYVRYAPVRLDEGYDNYPESIEVKQDMVDLANDVIFHKDTQSVTFHNNKFDFLGISLITDRCWELDFKP